MVVLGREISEQRDYSEAVAEEIDAEVRTLVEWAHDEARRIIQENHDKLVAVAERLLEIETIERAEFEAIMDGAKLPDLDTGTKAPPTVQPDDSAQTGKQQRDDDSNRPTLGSPSPSPA
jgi:cell division protease FtsH